MNGGKGGSVNVGQIVFFDERDIQVEQARTSSDDFLKLSNCLPATATFECLKCFSTLPRPFPFLGCFGRGLPVLAVPGGANLRLQLNPGVRSHSSSSSLGCLLCLVTIRAERAHSSPVAKRERFEGRPLSLEIPFSGPEMNKWGRLAVASRHLADRKERAATSDQRLDATCSLAQ